MQPSCLIVNEAYGPESADAAAAESATADPKIFAKEEPEVINLSSDSNAHKLVSISASLSVEERMHLVELLQNIKIFLLGNMMKCPEQTQNLLPIL